MQKNYNRSKRTAPRYPNARRAPLRSRKFASNKLRIMVLGGLEEVGRNCTLFEYGNEIIVIDMGLQFPEEDMPGIDYIVPNFDYVRGKEKNIKGVIITHGHYDHIGGIPHIMGNIGNPPMYMGRMTAGLVRKREEDYRNNNKLNIAEINEDTKLQLGNYFRIEFLRVNHSIPDCFAVIIHTPAGTIIHTGDFKIDFSPINDKPADLNRIAQIGGQGVLMLMSDSTDAVHPGYQISESAIGSQIGKILENVDGRIIIGTFASQLSRVQQLLTLAEKHGRKVYLQGRSMNNNVEIAHKIGYLKFNPKLLVNDAEFRRLPDNKVMIIGTGAQAESNAFLLRVVNGEHRTVKIQKNDTVIFSSSVIPGNERSIQKLKDSIVGKGAKVVHYQMMDVHAGGHAKQEDLKLMMRLLKPEYLMPIEGNLFMLKTHAELAEQIGISPEKIFVASNGQVVEFKKGARGKTVGELTNEKVVTDYVMVDGLGVGDSNDVVLRDRRMLAQDGMFVVIVTLDTKTGELIGNPDIVSRGFVYLKEHKPLIEQARMRVKKLLKDSDIASPTFEDYLKNKIRNDIGQFLFTKTKKRPMVLPVLIEV
ncbi:ribonuclease J [Patescibacteria group bacterium]|nr:ribonuclease J [Patescibacteria group bacterium]